ncbi:MAG: flavoprotein [Candidatus Omnitrophota bacterium]
MKKEIVLGITGSVAAYKACDLIGLLRREGHSVNCILTKEAQEFITPLTLQTLSANPVYTDMFEAPDEWNPRHISLAKKADILLIAPASANIVGKLAGGICDDLLTCTALAMKAPVLLAPAMNEAMYAHKIVKENIAKLKKIGYEFIGPVQGHLACGGVGMGHIAPLGEIIKEVKKLLK